MTQRLQRSAGILLPVFSLPSPHGIGAFGSEAFAWVDFLARAGQRYWQVLPLGPTSFGDSPYQSFSAFAGNPYFIDLDRLVRDGLLTRDEVAGVDWGRAGRISYETLFRHREELLRKAHGRIGDRRTVDRFRADNRDWIEEYALFMAIKGDQGLRPWTRWPDDLRLRRTHALQGARERLAGNMDYHVFVQALFQAQWRELKEYANRKGVEIIGDIPIYVSMDSADVWADSQLFDLDPNRRPVAVAGCPPDAFAPGGQLWGNPLYRWDVHRQQGYRWWLRRMSQCLRLYDLVRIDHFRGFESYYAIPADTPNARNGRWRQGPGIHFIDTLNRTFGPGRIIAEDLGFLDDRVHTLLRQSGYPGMKILQFAFDSREESDYLPHGYDAHCAVYTGTHDNDTIRGWFSSIPEEDAAYALEYLGLEDRERIGDGLVRAALACVADTAVIPLQDYLDLGSEARINIPSTLGGENWRWRLTRRPGGDVADRIARLTRLYGRDTICSNGGK